MKIAFITYYFPPLNSIASRRTYGWVKYLKRLGHDIYVVTADTPDPEIMKTFSVDTSFVTVHRLKYFDVRGLLNKVFKTNSMIKKGVSDSDNEKKGGSAANKVVNMVLRWSARRGILFTGGRFPTFSDQWFKTALKFSRRLVSEKKIDVVITSSPPPVVNLVGLNLKRRFKDLVWVMDLRDLWTQHPNQKGIFPFTIFERIAEKDAINNADAIITVSEPLTRQIKSKYPRKDKNVFCIENGFDEELIANNRLFDNHRPKGAIKKSLVYAGTLYRERNDLRFLFDAVSKKNEYFRDKIEISFYGSYATKIIIEEHLEQHPQAAGIIKYSGFVSWDDIIEKEKNADALLFIENENDSGGGILTGKIFEYMMVGNPILCLGITPSSYIGSMLKKTGLALFCENNTSSIKEKLQLLIERAVEIYPEQEYIQRFSHKNQVERLVRIISQHPVH